MSDGVVILGGAHGALALARSLTAAGAPVWSIGADSPLVKASRCFQRCLTWPGPSDPKAISFLIDAAARYGLHNWLLLPAGDAEVQLVAEERHSLDASFRILLPEWDTLKCVCEKPLLYRYARSLGIAVPRTYESPADGGLDAAQLNFPLILKPNMGGGRSSFSRSKGVLVADAASFQAAYLKAIAEIGRKNVVVQEFLSGDGENQFSYAALWIAGTPVAEFTARRRRQYPVDFGYTSTFVETAHEPQAISAARVLLSSIGYNGLVEVEFKRDMRDGVLKLLDVNPRTWTWFALASAAGIDLGAYLWAFASGRSVLASAVVDEAAWMYLTRDVVAAASLMARKRLDPLVYIHSFGSVRAWASFAAADPLPALLDLPVTCLRVLTRRILRWS